MKETLLEVFFKPYTFLRAAVHPNEKGTHLLLSVALVTFDEDLNIFKAL